MNVFDLLEIQKHSGRTDECNKCIHKLCCVVYRICASSRQGRTATIIKEQYERCPHLGEGGECAIYEARDKHAGYDENCVDFTCHNAGPLLSEWIERNNISIIPSSHIGALLRRIQQFITIGNRYDERYRFLQNMILETYTNTEDLWVFLNRADHVIESEFQKWANENPEDPEFDRVLGRLFAQE